MTIIRSTRAIMYMFYQFYFNFMYVIRDLLVTITIALLIVYFVLLRKSNQTEDGS